MTTKSTASIVLFLSLNILLFTIVSGCGSCVKPKPKPKPPACPPPSKSPSKPPSASTPPTPSKGAKCPTDALKLGVCADLLGDLLNLNLGSPPVEPCCSLLQGLADVEAAVCLCTALKANVLGINLNVPISLSLLLNVCSKEAPDGFKCA